MNFGLRPMRLDDIAQVAEIEREAFPTTWPPTPFKKELQNRLANYLVTWIPAGQQASALRPSQSGDPVTESRHMLQRLMTGVRGLFSSSPGGHSEAGDFVAGYEGIWFMADEAHVVAIGVKSAYQRMGLGELLMQGGVELSIARRMRSMTLEARVSNAPAHALYEKYGFRKVGVRKSYYADNKEDAVIMTAENILSSAYQEMFESRVEVYRQRRGEVNRILA
ncbi:MAG: ribosomal-protein-alanine N-acetyltransferase [Dehalococcoidia bacterium]|nr:ribosomal-protein-alanine N-acetyltransferase [Dehalococcoidia bacterium]